MKKMNDIDEVIELAKEVTGKDITWMEASRLYNEAYYDTSREVDNLHEMGKEVNFLEIFYKWRLINVKELCR